NERKLNPFGVLMGLTMVAATARGRAFTPSEARGLLADSGFARIRLLEPIGFNQVFVATKPVPLDTTRSTTSTTSTTSTEETP
ncbi:MAG: hypothetical protein PV358_16765, partial [Acidimicrobiales bacterium]|nr:hypothetical protein [Acidimicrobiales bacterium]